MSALPPLEGCGKASSRASKYISCMPAEVTTPPQFRREVLESKVPTLAVFYAGWCPFCQSFLPVFRSNETRAPGSPRFVEVDISDEDNPLWEEYSIEIVPTLVYFEGGRATARIDGRPGRGLKASDVREVLEAPKP